MMYIILKKNQKKNLTSFFLLSLQRKPINDSLIMKKFIYFVLFGVIMPMAFTGCDGEDNPVSNSFYLSAEQKVTIQQSNQFAFNLYKKLNNQADVANESNVLTWV